MRIDLPLRREEEDGMSEASYNADRQSISAKAFIPFQNKRTSVTSRLQRSFNADRIRKDLALHEVKLGQVTVNHLR